MIYLLSHIIDHSAERYPDHPAVRFNNQSVAYSELVRRADNLACLLQEQGIQRLDRVGVFLNKSIETLVAIYGIMKAGAAYVPLDPLSPVSRLAFVLQDCGIHHLVTQEVKLSALRQLIPAQPILEHVLGVPESAGLEIHSTGWEEIYSLTGSRVKEPGTMEQDLAYIMYTSGSTGNPKGLMHTHASGLSYARLAAHTYSVEHGDRLSNHSPLHFDMSTFDYFSGPLAGATTVIIPEAYTKLPASLSQLMQNEQLTIWYSVPFALIQLLLRGALANRDLRSLRWVLFGGEPFPAKHLRALMSLWPHARFSNVYGPAEVNQCTYYHVPALRDEDEAIPIGRIWENAEGIVVDEHDHVMPDGEVGELLVRTPTMMRGYWNRPDLNERAFYRRMVFNNYEEVFYRTGDLVQCQPDGNYRFLGRKDRQVKTRGYRVELDEVESALASHEQVEESAVFAVPGEEGSSEIRAAVILKAGAAMNAEPQEVDLKNFVSGLLPWYAVPQRILILPDFPRTGSGKIDRRRLSEQAMQGLEITYGDSAKG